MYIILFRLYHPVNCSIFDICYFLFSVDIMFLIIFIDAMTGHAHDTIPGQLFANLHIGNYAGKKVTLVWSEEDSPKSRDIEDGESVDIRKTIPAGEGGVAGKPSYDFQVREYDTGNNLMINGENTYTVTTSDDPQSIQFVEITAQGLYCSFLY